MGKDSTGEDAGVMNNRGTMKQFEQFKASMLFCPGCKQAVPVREKLLLVLADGDLYDYMCVYCASSVGSRKESQTKEVKILL
jgi:hypothetical protein